MAGMKRNLPGTRSHSSTRSINGKRSKRNPFISSGQLMAELPLGKHWFECVSKRLARESLERGYILAKLMHVSGCYLLGMFANYTPNFRRSIRPRGIAFDDEIKVCEPNKRRYHSIPAKLHPLRNVTRGGGFSAKYSLFYLWNFERSY